MIRDGTWEPREFAYPQFPKIVVAAAARSYDAMVRLGGGASPRGRIPSHHDMYDQLEPFEFLMLARVLSVAVGMAIVVLTGLFARRLFGPVAGAAAILTAAVVPALALRGSIASVDSYATLAALGCLYVTDVTRTAQRPGVAAFAAGLLAGVTFASKYPAVLVFVALVVTTLLLPISMAERARRMILGAAGTVVGALTAMPALWWRAALIRQVLRFHLGVYAHAAFEPSLWRQALFAAEGDLNYAGPELGIVFCLFAFAGLAVGLRRRSLFPTVAGWCAFGGAMCLLFGRNAFRPFRNLMPLLPIGCVAASMAFVRLREASRRPALVDAMGALALAILYGLPVAAYARSRFDFVDSRRAAIDWLALRALPDDTTLCLRELAILDGEVARVPGKSACLSWEEAPGQIRAEAPRFVLGGVRMLPDHSLQAAAHWPELAGYRPVFEGGRDPTPPFDWWRGNEEIVVVFERAAPR